MKFKVIENVVNYESIKVGRVYEGRRLSKYGIELNNGKGSWLYMYDHEVELIEEEQDLREMLKIGYKVGDEYSFDIIDSENSIHYYKIMFDRELHNHRYKISIDEIYRPKYNGIKTVFNPEWELVWKRKEELYTLQCPITNEYLYKNQLNEYCWEIAGETFTQKEIDDLPNQDLIKTLVKKEYKGDK